MNREPDKEELLKLIDFNKGILFKIVNAYCKNENDREDLVQEIVYQLLRSYKNYKADHKFSTWMYRVALNVAISFYRKTKTKVNMIKLIEFETEIEDKIDHSEELEKNIVQLQQFISELNELDKAMMILYLEEKTYVEIADIIGISTTNVATKLSRIKDKLKQKFLTLS